MRKLFSIFLIFGLVVILFSMELKVGKVDTECSLAVIKGVPATRIVASTDEQYKISTFGDDAILFAEGGNIKDGETYLVVSKIETLKNGYFVYRMAGYVKVLRHEANKAVVRVEKSCTGVRIGDYIMKFTPEPEFTVKEDRITREAVAPKGNSLKIVFLESEFFQLGDSAWAVIDGGEKQGLKRGDILLIFRPVEKVKKPIGKAVIIRTSKDYSVIKTFSTIDAVLKGDLVFKR